MADQDQLWLKQQNSCLWQPLTPEKVNEVATQLDDDHAKKSTSHNEERLLTNQICPNIHTDQYEEKNKRKTPKSTVSSDSTRISTPLKKQDDKGSKPNSTKMKKHRPKVVSEGKKKSPMRAKNDTTTKKRKYVSKNSSGGGYKEGKKHEIRCVRQLNFDIEDQSIVEVQNNVPKEIKINLLSESETRHGSSSFRVYKRACKCLISIRKLQSNCPAIFKKKRFNKRRKETRFSSHPWLHSCTGGDSFASMVSLCNLKIGIKKKKRSSKPKENIESKKWLIRSKPKGVSKNKNNIDMKHSSPLDSENEDKDSYRKVTKKIIKEIEALSKKLKKLDINEVDNKKKKKLNINELDDKVDHNGTMVPFVPKKKTELLAKVELDEESLRAWNRLLLEDGLESDKENERTNKWWENERKVFCDRVDFFIGCLHHLQGDRSFSPWKGSVVDSVVGVFLTQNVSDHLSSSAFMSLAAKYPIKPASNPELCSEDLKLIENNESIGHNKEVEEQISRGETIQCKTHESKNETETVNMLKAVALDEDIAVNKCDITDETKNLHEQLSSSGMGVNEETPVQKEKKNSAKKQKETAEEKSKIYWESLRKLYSGNNKKRSPETMDSVDWEAVRRASVEEVAHTIRHRGQQNIIGEKIKKFLDRLVADHGSIDLEWLRNVPQKDAKEYLSSIHGIGLKSVECLRLLSLQHNAFPVDTNVGRVTVRMGWVPLRPLPDSLLMHLLNAYPDMDSIQKYIWPRLCKLAVKKLYELHYQMITFGKIFCTKRKPNCKACPMQNHCKHYASKNASEKLALPAPGEKSATNTNENHTTSALSYHNAHSLLETGFRTSNCEPIIEEPVSPGREYTASPEMDIEDYFMVGKFTTLAENLSENDNTALVENLSENDYMFSQDDCSKAIIAINPLTPRRPELKSIKRLRTQHEVYQLPDSHPVLDGLEERDPDDKFPYLFAIWPGETKDPLDQPIEGTAQDSRDSQTVCGTILIPVRTAMRGAFPLNGTYFQTNEVFVDHETSLRPINAPTVSLWNLQRRTVYCGTSVASIYNDLSATEIRNCSQNGYVCVRGFERETRAPRPLSMRFHARPITTPSKPWVPKAKRVSKAKTEAN